MTEIQIARRYCQSYKRAKRRGLEFNLSLRSVANLLKAKRCYYTGVLLTDERSGKTLPATYRTIDRVDNSKGYIKGNVVACCYAANAFKNEFLEQPNLVNGKAIQKMLKVMR